MHTKFTYDGRGFVSQTNTYKASSAQPYTKRDYYRDRIIAWKKGSYNSINPMENSRGDRYTYDNEGQLTAASYQATTPEGTPGTPQRTESFIYDELGNRKGANVIAGRGNVTFNRRDNGLNEYLNWTPSALNYDEDLAGWGTPGHANGVLMQDGWFTAGYNALNQLYTAWTPSATGGVAFYYDPLGRCVKRRINTATTYLYYDGWNLIQDGPNAATADRIYVHGNRIDEIVAYQYGGLWNYLHYDARGHCILATNASGSIVEQYDYNAFGLPYFYNASGTSLPNGTSIGNKFLFTGREWLADLKLYDYRNRMYQPELGRFMQPDPKQFDAGDYNLYRYCHNDPVNRHDPFGLLDIKWRESGNTTDPKTENHHTDEKLKTPEGKPAAGKTTHDLKTEGNKDGSVTADLKVDWKVRKEQALKDPQLAPREKQHADRWHNWVERMKSANSDASKHFRDKNYASPEEAAKAVRAFLEPYRRNENIQQKLDYDLPHGRHDIDYGLKD